MVYNLHQKNGRPGIGGLDVLRQKKRQITITSKTLIIYYTR